MKKLTTKRDALLKKMLLCSPIVKGSITSVCATCNRAKCICAKNTERRAYRLTYKDRSQKTKIVYVAQNRLPEISKMIANYSALRKIIDQLILANLEIFKNKGGR